MAKLFNLARMTTATTGTGTITLGAAVSGYLTFALAGVSNGDVVSYGIKDGANSEVGTGTYTSSGTTLSRTVISSTNSNAAINLSGSAEVFITPVASDFHTLFPGQYDATQTNDDAATGKVGEYAYAVLPFASRVTLSNGTYANIISVSLTAGDWDVTGFVNFEGSSTPSTAYARADISATSGTANNTEGYYAYGPGISSATSNVTGSVPLARFSLSTTTLIYLVAVSGINSGTIRAWGTIRARRVR